jgi:formate dehydrogenase major subunit
MVLITGRQLEHWHTGSMTRRAGVLDAIEPDPVALVHPLDLAELRAQAGRLITIESRRGEVSLYARADEARRAARSSCRSATTRRPSTA